MKKRLLQITFLLSLGFSALAMAVTLDEAKSQGLIGEKVDGYIAAVNSNPSAEIQALIDSTNAGRQQVYAELAKRNGITIQAVGIMSAEKLRDKAQRGDIIQSSNGQWEKK